MVGPTYSNFTLVTLFFSYFHISSSLSFHENDIACFLGNDNSDFECDIKKPTFPHSKVNGFMKMIIILKQNKVGKRYELSKAYSMSSIIIGKI